MSNMLQICLSALSVPALGEMEQTICMLERGTLVTKLYSKHRPEQRRLILVRETRQLLWSAVTSVDTRVDYEGSLELREIREIRVGKNSKDFRQYNCIEESKRYDEDGKCFVVLYGSAFKLKTFSIIALSEQEADNWVRGLRYMVDDTSSACYPLQIERWLRREYYAIENATQAQVTVKDFKNFLSSISCKIATTKLMECFTEEDMNRKHDLRFDDFSRIYRHLLTPSPMIDEIFQGAELADYVTGNQQMSLEQFQQFLLKEQQDTWWAHDAMAVGNFMSEFIHDIERDVQAPYFNINEFLDYLFSKQNEIWSSNKNQVYQDMTQPLSSYWIASSHNTYLTGDQFSSESSCEAYARALRMGCRCIELDCWDGVDNLPSIYHGHTMTSKIKFKDVIQTIKDNAFITSEYPVILSIEQNCSLEQQRNMAHAFIEVFGDMLLIQRSDPNESELPSPYQLRRKIILKHKKLPEYEDSSGAVSFTQNIVGRTSSISLTRANSLGVIDENDNIRNILKEGMLYYNDPVDKGWHLYHFVLTQQELIYTSRVEDSRTAAEEEEQWLPSLAAAKAKGGLMTRQKENFVNDELHFGENWFHGKLEGGRQEADQLLETHKHLGDGTFLVRESDTFVGDYSLSFWRRNRPNHCRIKLKHENGATKYYLVDNFLFDSLYALIIYYRKNVLRGPEFSITLKEPVPQPRKHETQIWFHGQTTKEQAEQALIKMETGSFLVRPSVQGNNTYVISFTIPRRVIHCRILQEGRLFIVDTNHFESLISLVNYYMRNPLYHRVKLLHAVSQAALQDQLHDTCNNISSPDIQEACNYIDPNLNERVTCKALYCYKAIKPDELSFPKHAIISNVQRNISMWWRGDYGGLLQRHFPANYVKVLETGLAEKSIHGGDFDSNKVDSIVLNGAVASLRESTEPGILMKLQLQTPSMQQSCVIGFDNQELAYEWIKAIQEAAQLANQLVTERRKKERSARVAKEMSDLIIYFRSVPFREHSWIYSEMSSFSETKAEKQMLQQNTALFLSYHRKQISRVYPKGQRFDSSNFNPVPFWNIGAQMLALNYQTGDKAMQINQAKFRDNGQCGYLLKPNFMQSEDFEPHNPLCLKGVEPLQVRLRIIGGRHLFRAGKCNNPFLLVELIGASFDNGQKHRTKSSSDNGFIPLWNENCEFLVRNPYFAMLRFEVHDEDMFSETNFIAQATYPLLSLRNGYRSVVLRNKFSEEIELASLLVHIDIKHIMKTNEGVLVF